MARKMETDGEVSESHSTAALRGRRTSRVRNARMGDRSMVPPMGGIMPRNRLRYGSVIDARGPKI